jgi:succinate dehydrogenase / fumarate reductase, cytochrome b subunit
MAAQTPVPVTPAWQQSARKYGGQFAGMTAWFVQRTTGLLLLFYLFLHVRTVHKLSEGPAAFNEALAVFRSPFFKLLEIGLLATVVIHAMNGVRLTLLDLGIGHSRQRQLFWALAAGLGGLLFLAGAIPIFLSGVLKI